MAAWRQTEQEMTQVLDKLQEEYSQLRTGRASAALVENILVPYYGTLTPLKQTASISIPEASVIQIQPWDKNLAGEIENAIRQSGKGLSPVNNGQTVRVTLPPMTDERRQELVKMIYAQAEEAKVALRNVRHKAWEQVLSEVKSGQATEDDKYRGEKELNELIARYNKKIEESAADKEKEIKSI